MIRKSNSRKGNKRGQLLLAAAAGVSVLGLIHSAQAATYTWDADTGTTGAQDGAGTWNTTNTNWWNGSDVAWPGTASNTALFGVGGTPGTVTVSGTANVNSGSLTFAGGYTLSGGSITNISAITVNSGVGAVTIGSDMTSNTATNLTITNNSTNLLTINGNTAINATTSLKLQGPITINGNISGTGKALDAKTNPSTITLAGNNTYSARHPLAARCPLVHSTTLTPGHGLTTPTGTATSARRQPPSTALSRWGT